jgi:hypothetical protein
MHISKNDIPSEIRWFTPDEKPYGLSYGQWTAKWWQWALSIPVSINPVSDETGAHAMVKQDGLVWFLAGTFGENKIPYRKCIVPFGKAVLFPVINYEANYIQDSQFKTDSELAKHVIEDINDITILRAIIDGQKVQTYRVKSEPSTFPLFIHEDNGIGSSGGNTIAAGDGYWVFLKPLSFGVHTIYFHGACSGGARNSTATYEVTIA